MADTNEEQQQKRSRRQRRLSALFAVALGLAALILIGSLWYATLNDVPVLKIPQPVIPNPNARDYFNKACEQLVDNKKWEEALALPGRGGKTQHSYTLAEQAALIRENGPAIQTLHQGFAFPYAEIPARSYNTMFPNYAKYRSLARFLALKSRVEAAQGDYDAAINSHLDAIQLGEMIPHGAPLIGSLVGIAVQAIAGKGAEDVISHLNAAQARAAAKRLEQIIALRMSWADVLQEEKWSQQAGLIEIFRDPKWHENVRQMVMPDDEDGDAAEKRGRLEKLRDIGRIYLINKHEVLYNYTHYMDQLIANARLPYAAHPPAPPIPSDPINELLSITGDMGRNKAVQMDAQEAQLCLRLALRAYKLEHGVYPPTLEALVPAYLSRLPDDPYAMQGSYGYTRDKVGFTLSSGGALLQSLTASGSHYQR
jgi:hypothetical protein